MSERKVINVRATNRRGMTALMVTYDDHSGEHLYYTEPSDCYHPTICHLDVDELIGLTEEELYIEVRNAMLY